MTGSRRKKGPLALSAIRHLPRTRIKARVEVEDVKQGKEGRGADNRWMQRRNLRGRVEGTYRGVEEGGNVWVAVERRSPVWSWTEAGLAD